MPEKTRVLLQTTIPFAEDDWHIGRFSMLRDVIASMEGVEVVARDRGAKGVDDPLLSKLAESDFDQLWLFGVDPGDGLTKGDCSGITAFARRGGAILATRDHQDCGASICEIGGVGAAHFFNTHNPSPDESLRQRDDEVTRSIDWPNYYSGPNGEYQRIVVDGEPHPLLRREDGTAIEWFPSHPHEGEVGVPRDEPSARVIARSSSRATGRPFNLAVAFEESERRGRAIAESSFHHFCDYNWDTRAGCPSFVEEAPADAVLRDPSRLEDVRAYVRNAVKWLAGSL